MVDVDRGHVSWWRAHDIAIVWAIGKDGGRRTPRVTTCAGNVSVMPAGCSVSVRYSLEVRSALWLRAMHFLHDSLTSSLRRYITTSVTSSALFHVPLPAAIASTVRRPHTLACPGGKEEGRQLVHVTNVACRAGRLEFRAREPAASVRTVSPRARAVQLAEGAPGCVARESAGPQTFAFGPKRERQASHTDHVTPVTGSAFVNCQYRSYTWRSCV